MLLTPLHVNDSYSVESHDKHVAHTVLVDVVHDENTYCDALQVSHAPHWPVPFGENLPSSHGSQE